MASVVIDKKQLPQVIILGVITLGVFGFFGMKMFVPPPTQAAAPSSTPATVSSGSLSDKGGALKPGTTTSSSNTDPGTPNTASLIGAAAPSDSMRDPFIALAPIASSEPVVTPAPKAPSVTGPTLSASSSIPGLGQIKPLPMPSGNTPIPNIGALPNPTSSSQQQGTTPAVESSWQLTGIIQSDTDSSNALAVVRDSSNHKYLKLGDSLDEHTKLIGIDKNSITLLRDGHRIQLGVSATISEQLTAPASAPAPKPDSKAINAQPTPESAIPGLVIAPLKHASIQIQATPKHQQSSVPTTQTYKHGAAD